MSKPSSILALLSLGDLVAAPLLLAQDNPAKNNQPKKRPGWEERKRNLPPVSDGHHSFIAEAGNIKPALAPGPQ